MKKKIFLLAFMLFTVSLTTFSMETAKVDSNVNNLQLVDSAKLTTMKVYTDVMSGLSGLAKGLKTTAEHVYVILVKQQVVNAISSLIFDLLISVLTLLFFRGFFKNYKRISDSKDDWFRDSLEDHFGLVGYLVFGIILGVITIIALAANMGEIITGFVNPEYGAIKDIFHFIK